MTPPRTTLALLATLAAAGCAADPHDPEGVSVAELISTRPIDPGGGTIDTDPGFAPIVAARPFDVVEAEDGVVHLMWQDRSEAENENHLYRIEIDPAGGTYESPFADTTGVRIATFGPQSGWPTYTDSTVENGKLYCYYLRTIGPTSSARSTVSCTYDRSCLYTGPRNRPHPRAGTLVATTRVRSQNVFGVPDDHRSSCESRLRGIARELTTATPPYDVVGIQELYTTTDGGLFTCSPLDLTVPVGTSGAFSGARLFEPTDGLVRPRGGIGVYTRGPLEGSAAAPWGVEEWSVTDAAQGYVFARVRIPDTAVRLDVYVAHLDANVDGGDEVIRAAQMQQLALAIHARSATSGNPVLVMGDFNTGGAPSCRGNFGYQNMMYWFRHPIDLWVEAHPYDAGPTHADERIDYLLLLTDPYFTSSPYQVVVDSIERVVPRALDGTVASDHLGLDARLSIHRPCPYLPGHGSYCAACGPCDSGEADCDSNAECRGPLVCRNDVGSGYGLPATYDVCECPVSPGHPDYCRDCGPCAAGTGDCDSNAQCRGALICAHDVGARYGLPASYDVCECPWAPGDLRYCRDCGPCAAGVGGCSDDYQCAGDLTCQFGVCVGDGVRAPPPGTSACFDDCLDECTDEARFCIALCNAMCADD